MAEEARLGPVVDVVPQAFLYRCAGKGRRVTLVSGGVLFGEIVLKACAPDYVKAARNTRKKITGIVNVELVGIEIAPPITRAREATEGGSNLGAEGIVKRDGGAFIGNDARLTASEAANFLPCAIIAPVVVDKNVVAPFESGTKRMADDVSLVFHEADAEDTEWLRRARHAYI